MTARGDVRRYYDQTVLNHDGDNCLIWPFFRDRNGYPKMGRNGKVHLVTRCICEDVYGPPPTEKHQAAHSCGKGHLGCVAKKHLRWALPTENEADKLLHGTDNRGERSGLSVLSEAAVVEILALQGVLPTSKIAHKYGVSEGAIQNIFDGRSWAWLSTNRKNNVERLRAKGIGHGMVKLSESDVRAIRREAGTSTVAHIARRYGVSRIHVNRIISRQVWKHLD